MKLLRPALLAFSCLLLPSALASNQLPSLGDASSSIVSPEQEYLLGRAWLSLVRGQVPQLSDPLLKEFVEAKVYSLAETSQLNDRRLEFVLLNTPQLNAFAAPGGIIGVNGGLFLYAQTEAEFASVMAHELAHLSQRHFARGIEAQQRMQIPLMAAMLAGVVAAAAGAGDAGIATIMSAQAAAMQEQRRFSRQNEQEADRIGLVNLQRAGYDARAMPSMFERMMKQYRYDRLPPEFLLTHPLSETRVADTRNRAEQLPEGGVQDSLRYQLMRARLQLQYEDTPGVAAKRFRALLDENPRIDAARYGLALAQFKAGQLQEAQNTLAPLLSATPNELAYNLAQLDIDIAKHDLKLARARLNSQLELYPKSLALNQTNADLLLREGDIKGSEKAYEELARTRPKDPDIWYVLAEVRGLAGNIVGLHQARAEYFALVGDYEPALEQLALAKRRTQGNFQLASRIEAREKALQDEQRFIKQLMR